MAGQSRRDPNWKEKQKNTTKMPFAAALVAAIALLFSRCGMGGLGFGGLPGDGGRGGAQGAAAEAPAEAGTGAAEQMMAESAAETTAAAVSAAPETEAAEEITEASEAESGAGEMRLRVNGYQVFLNDEEITAEKPEELGEAVRKAIEENYTDDTKLYLDCDYGDYNTSNTIRDILKDLAIEAEAENEVQ